MYTSVGFRAAAAYQKVSVETAVDQASPHELINMLMVGLLKNVGAARAAMARGDIAGKGKSIGQAVRIIEEGLKPALNLAEGGEIAANLNGLYGFCTNRLTEANLRNQEDALLDVVRVIEPLADGWRQIGEQVSGYVPVSR